MGFRSGAYATIWEIKPASDVRTNGRISISKKDKNGTYVQEYSGYVSFLGTLAASKALGLKKLDRIRLKDVDVSNKYDKAKNTTYTNFNIFSFDSPEELEAEQQAMNSGGRQTQSSPQPQVDSGEIDDSRLPF